MLDLGRRAGRDLDALAQLVGVQGHMFAADMTAAQLAVAECQRDDHLQSFGYGAGNVDLRLG